MMISLMKLLFSNQYNMMMDIIKNLMEENERLKAENDELAQEIYSLREDLACLKWDLSPAKKFLDFPNSEKDSEDKIY